MVRYVVAFSIILAAALSRLLPHEPNVAPITALALFGAIYLERRLAFVLPLIAMLISDSILGFHNSMPWVYASFMLTGIIGIWLRNHRGVLQTVGATLGGSVLFYVVTNFGVWISTPGMYTPDLSGLINCYVMAIPFFRNTVIGDLGYVAVLFGIFELAQRTVPALQREPVRVPA